MRGADVARRRQRRRDPDRARAEPGAQPRRAACEPGHHQDLPLWPVRSRSALPRLRRHAEAGVLHQDRLAPGAHLYRPARAQGHLQRASRSKPVEGAAVVGLGCGDADARAAGICRVGRAVPAPAARGSGPPAGARRAGRGSSRVFRVPADTRQARPYGLGRRGHLRPQLERQATPPRWALRRRGGGGGRYRPIAGARTGTCPSRSTAPARRG